ncbi:hypothetical protein BH11BAC7_BH11BAC7_29310 [soil metagenome]
MQEIIEYAAEPFTIQIIKVASNEAVDQKLSTNGSYRTINEDHEAAFCLSR